MTRTFRLSWLVLAVAVLAVSPALADDYLVYHEAGVAKGTNLWIWCGESPPDQGLCPLFSSRFDICNNPEGSQHLSVTANEWAGFGLFYVDDQAPPQNTLTEDLSAFASGDIRFFVKSPLTDISAGFQCDEGSGVVAHELLNVLGIYGSGPTNTWQEIVIPVTDLYAGTNLTACLQNVSASFVTTGAPMSPFFYQVDYIRWHKPNSHAGASSVTVSGRQLMVDGKPFVVNGVAYSPHSIGENTAGGFRDRSDLYADDFSGIAAMGANAVRIYSSFMTTAMLDAAWANGLHVIPTFGIDKVQLQCDAGWGHMQARLEDVIQEWKNHPAILLWMLGNEVEVGQTQADLCGPGGGAASCQVSSTVCANDGDCPTTSGFCQFTTTQTCDPTASPSTCPDVPGTTNNPQFCVAETCAKGWYPQLDVLTAAADVVDPSHPTATSNADVFNIGFAGCSDDTTLDKLDLWGMNLYRGCTFQDALTTYDGLSGKPLIISEFGKDAWKDGGGTCSLTATQTCLVNGDCPGVETCVRPLTGTCSLTATTFCNEDIGCPVGEICVGQGVEDQNRQEVCLASLVSEASAALAVNDPVGVSTGQIVFEWMDEWWKSFDVGSCFSTYWDKHDSCEDWTNSNYPVDTGMNEEWWGIATRETYCSNGTTLCTTDADCPGAPGSCSTTTSTPCRLDSECPGACSETITQSCVVDEDCPGLCSANPPTTCASNDDCNGQQTCIFGNERCVFETCDQAACNVVLDPTKRVLRGAYSSVGESWRLGAVLNLEVATHDGGTGDTTVSFDPAAGSADHTLYYGPLSTVSSYTYSGSQGGLGATGSNTVTLPAGSLFFLVVGQNAVEGCYGKDSACSERPSEGSIPPALNGNCSVPQCP